jgi:cation transport protein ChaC
VLSKAHYQQIFADANGRYGSTYDYALQTLESLQRIGISDAALAKLLKSI